MRFHLIPLTLMLAFAPLAQARDHRWDRHDRYDRCAPLPHWGARSRWEAHRRWEEQRRWEERQRWEARRRWEHRHRGHRWDECEGFERETYGGVPEFRVRIHLP